MQPISEQVGYWLQSAKHDLDTAETLFKNKRYDWCLFLAHLVLEKTLKAIYVRDNGQFPPKIHKLDVLAERTALKLKPGQIDFLKEVNDFNLEARYPDYKFKFYKLCTREFAKRYFDMSKEFYQCLLKELK